ncbi:MAG: hypothetical protein JST33_05920 [Actinobacteria bacterium]|nr:hypothetical protein [Actinomycetota bacterium]
MCDSCAEGGRRCPGSNSPEARAAHNTRRRENRSARAAVVSWARQRDLPELALDVLAVAPPTVAKEWAEHAGAPIVQHGDQTRLKPTSTGLRDASWASAGIVDQVAAIARAQGAHPDEAALLNVNVVHDDYEDEGVNTTRRLILDDGSDAYFKPIDGIDEETAEDYGHDQPWQPIHEVAAWHTARALGPEWERLVPPCVLTVRDGSLGSLALGQPGSTAGPVQVPDSDVHAAAFFDALTGQQDRHTGNFLTHNNGEELHLIDHGFAFARPDDPVNMSVFQLRRFRTAPELTTYELDRLVVLLRTPDLHGLRPMLAPDRAAALEDRARLMLVTGRILPEGHF